MALYGSETMCHVVRFLKYNGYKSIGGCGVHFSCVGGRMWEKDGCSGGFVVGLMVFRIDKVDFGFIMCSLCMMSIAGFLVSEKIFFLNLNETYSFDIFFNNLSKLNI